MIPSTSSEAASSLRLKIAMLLSDAGDVRDIAPDDIDYLDGISRSIDAGLFEDAGIAFHSMDASESADENSTTYELLVFRAGDAYIVGRVCYPSYSDDNSDGQLSYLSDELTFDKARAWVAEEFERVQDAIRAREKEVKKNEVQFLKRIDELRDEPALVPIDEDEGA